MGLDSLSNSMVGSAIGTLFLSDLASTAGSLYNYGTEQEAPKKQSLMGKLLAPIKEVYSEKKRSAGAFPSMSLSTKQAKSAVLRFCKSSTRGAVPV